MLQEKRLETILEQLKENRTARIADLSKTLGVTRETIRKDLYDLEKQGLIKKVHGGAILTKINLEPTYANRSGSNVREKEAIARRAAQLVEDGEAIYIDLGTTTQLFAKYLDQKKGITVITNALLVALELANHPSCKVILSGGELRSGDLSLSGPVSRKSVEDFFVDKAFIGVGGLALSSGFTDYHVGESEIRRLMMKKAKETYALIDYSKFDVTAFTKVAGIDEIDVVITDAQAPQSIVQQLEENGVEVILVEIEEA